MVAAVLSRQSQTCGKNAGREFQRVGLRDTVEETAKLNDWQPYE